MAVAAEAEVEVGAEAGEAAGFSRLAAPRRAPCVSRQSPACPGIACPSPSASSPTSRIAVRDPIINKIPDLDLAFYKDRTRIRLYSKL